MLFDDLSKTKSQGSYEPGDHKLTIVEATTVLTKNGHKAVQFTYSVDDNEKFQIRFDNATIEYNDGRACNVGQYKLRKIMEATNVIPQGEFTIKTILPLLKGKSFVAELVRDKNDKYLVLDSDPDKIRKVDDVSTVTPEDVVEQNKLFTPSDSNW